MPDRKTNGQAVARPADERRRDSYTFTSKRDLIAFFAASLPRKAVTDTIRSVKEEFVRRKLSERSADKLQFFKKCEVELMKLVRERMEGSDTKEKSGGTRDRTKTFDV